MANERRLRSDSDSGTITDNPLLIGATTMNSAGLSTFPVVDSTSYMAITLDPLGLAGAPEIVWITAHTSANTAATIVRGKEGSTARQHALNTRWSHGPTSEDFDHLKTPMSRMYARANFK